MVFWKNNVPYGTDGVLPKDFLHFLLYVWRKNPVLWPIFFFQDLLHFTRFPIAFICLGKMIDVLRASDPAAGVPPNALTLIGIMVTVLFTGDLMHVWTAQTLVHWKPQLRAVIRSDFLRYALGHSHAYFQDHFAGALARKISEVAESAGRLHDIIRFQIGLGVIQIGSTLVFMLCTNVLYGIVLFLFTLTLTLPLLIRLPKIRQRSLRYSDQRAHVTGIVVDTLTNVPAIKSFSTLAHEMDVHGTQTAIEKKRSSKLIRNMIQIEQLRRISLVTLAGVMALLACLGWSQGWISVGEASTISSLSLLMTGATWILGNGIVQFVDEAGYITDALRITTRPHDIRDISQALDLQVRGGKIAYKNVGFAYSGQGVFHDLSLTIKAGEKIALVGPSGAGKSTFVSLLMRLYDIQQGEITIDGQNTAMVTQDSLRRNIAVIPQDTALFHRTLMENIRYGRLDATDDEVMAASKKAFAHDFIASLTEGYNTMVGERGIRLSGGQRQRIAIARAILKNAPVLVLDEATSALDSESERTIQTALGALMEGKTVIAIAHRLSTIARMDRIVVFDQGQIIEQGTHAELLNHGGLYARLWAMQSGGFLQDDVPHKTVLNQ